MPQPKIFTLLIILIVALTVSAESFYDTTSSALCPAGKIPLYFYCQQDQYWNDVTSGLKPDSLANDLRLGIEELGYCFIMVQNPFLIPQDSTSANQLLLIVSAVSYPTRSPDTQAGSVVVSLLPANGITHEALLYNSQRPLLSLSGYKNDPIVFRSAFVKKIIENLRASYICQLTIKSAPPGVNVVLSTGLTGKTPVEWILPVGTFSLVAEKENFLDFKKNVNLTKPGYHEYFITLEPRRFYNSKLTIGTGVFLVSGIICYGVEQYVYSRYNALGKDHTEKTFRTTFDTAKGFEYGALISFGATACCFALSFWL